MRPSTWKEIRGAAPKLDVTGSPPQALAACTQLLEQSDLGKRGRVEITISAIAGGLKGKAAAQWLVQPVLKTADLEAKLTGAGATGAELCKRIAKELVAERPDNAEARITEPGPAVEVGTGNGMTCSRHRSGEVRCWSQGQPVPLRPAQLEATQLSVDGSVGCALRRDGKVACWGGIEGDAKIVSEAKLACGISGAKALAVDGSGRTVCVIDDKAGVSCLKQSPEAYEPCKQGFTPSRVKGITNAKALAMGAFYGCALFGDGEIGCWKSAATEPLPKEIELIAISDPPKLVRLHQGSQLCGTDAGDAVWCLDSGRWERLVESVPHEVFSGNPMVRCMTNKGSLHCWGSNHNGEVGDGTKTFRKNPIQVKLEEVTTVNTAINNSCAISKGATYCWGKINVGPPQHEPQLIQYLPSAG